MPDLFLHLNGQQQGPFSQDQVRQLLVEGGVTAATPAWHDGLADWLTVGEILKPASVPGAPPAFAPPVPPTVPQKKGMPGWAIALIVAGICFFGLFVVSCLAGIALGPITNGIKQAQKAATVQSARAISMEMTQYAIDHNGAYPSGKTSTEVFQKLLDDGYATDAGIFYIRMPGKVRATSKHLTAENVCYDVTSGIVNDSPADTPVVFTTGYIVTYAPGGEAQPDPRHPGPFTGISVAYKSGMAKFLKSLKDGAVLSLCPTTFEANGKDYIQLTP